jgi:VWFA-related protein
MRPWTLVVLAVLAAVPLFAVEGPRMGETIDVSIVNVDAIVTDKQGNRVRGLTKDDFEIFENGKLQPVTNFTNVGQALSLSQGDASQHPQPRTIVVFIEHFRAPEFRRDPFFAGVRDFLHRTVRPGDSVKIVTFARKLETRLDFTDKLESVDRALDKISSESGPGVDEVTFEDQLLGQAFTSSINASRPGRASSSSGWRDANGNFHAGIRSEIRYQSTEGDGAQASFLAFRMRDKISAITSLMNSIAGSDTKKVFVMAVRRFGASGSTHGVSEVDNLAPSYGWSSRYRHDALIDYVSKTANANGITVYPLYPAGLGTEGFGLDAPYDYEVLNSQLPFLEDVAKQTGGKLAWGINIEKDLPKMAEDLDAYYSLGYRATNRNVDRARSIVVKTKNRDYTVRSRREYVEKSDQTRMRDRVIANLFEPQSASSMNITAEVGKQRYVEKGHYTIPVTVNIPVTSLMTDGGRGEFSVFVGWSGIAGEIGQVTKQSQKFKLTTSTPETFTYSFEVTADAATERLSIGVFDELSKDYGLRRIDLVKSGRVAGLR